MKKLFILPLLFFALSNFTVTSDKDQAKKLAKQIAKAYFDRDCKAYFKHWNDSIRLISPNKFTVIPASSVLKDSIKACERFNSKNRFDSGYTYQQYLVDYEIRIYSKSEFINKEILQKAKEDPTLAQTFEQYKDKYTDSDYFFSGTHLKSGSQKPEDEKINHWRSWVLVLSKTKNGWKITGLLP